MVLTALILRDTIEALSRADVMDAYGAADYTYYMHATRRWLAGGSFYEPFQLAGPYPFTVGLPLDSPIPSGAFYPPVALWLFAPFTVLPPLLWWVIPAALVIGALMRLRPDVRAWPVMVLCLWWPGSYVAIFNGNPVIWVAAALAVGVAWGGAAVFVLVKPSLLPFAIWGVRRRRWWVTLALFAIVCIPFGAMWADWILALTNARGLALTYSVVEVPLLLVPVIAWVAGPAGKDEARRFIESVGISSGHAAQAAAGRSTVSP